MSKITSVKKFNTVLGSIKKSGKTLRENVQDAVEFAMAQYAEHANSTFLSQLITTVGSTKTMAYNKLDGYIRAHANVRLTKHKDGKIDPATGKVMMVYKKAGDTAEVIKLETNWYDFNAETTASSKNPLAVLKAAYKTIGKAIENKALKDCTMAEAKREQKALGDLIDTLTKPSLVAVKKAA